MYDRSDLNDQSGQSKQLPLLLDDGQRRYIYGPQLTYAVDRTGTVEVYHTDGLNSVRALAI